MRASLAAVAFVVAVAVAGCSSGETKPNSPVDPEEAESSDYVVPAVIFAIAAVTGAALLAIVLILRRRRRDRPLAETVQPPDGKKGP